MTAKSRVFLVKLGTGSFGFYKSERNSLAQQIRAKRAVQQKDTFYCGYLFKSCVSLHVMR